MVARVLSLSLSLTHIHACARTHTHTFLQQQIIIKEAMNVKDSKEECMLRFEGRKKGRNNVIIISKIKKIIKNKINKVVNTVCILSLQHRQ